MKYFLNKIVEIENHESFNVCMFAFLFIVTFLCIIIKN